MGLKTACANSLGTSTPSKMVRRVQRGEEEEVEAA